MDQNGKYVKGYALGTIHYEEIKLTLDQVKSDKASISYIKATNKLLVYDKPAVHKVVQEILRQSSAVPVNITVDIDFANQRMLRERGISVGITTQKSPPELTINGRNQKTQQDNNASISLVTANGASGQLWSTRTALTRSHLHRYDLIPFQAHTAGNVIIRKAQFTEPMIRELGTSMWIQPSLLPSGLIEVELFPVVRYINKDKREHLFRVDKVSTKVTVHPNQRTFIGGNTGGMKTFLKDLFATTVSSRMSTDSLSVYVTCRVSTPGTRKRDRDSQSPLWRHFKE